jgi:hypothetical protein
LGTNNLKQVYSVRKVQLQLVANILINPSSLIMPF